MSEIFENKILHCSLVKTCQIVFIIPNSIFIVTKDVVIPKKNTINSSVFSLNNRICRWENIKMMNYKPSITIMVGTQRGKKNSSSKQFLSE